MTEHSSRNRTHILLLPVAVAAVTIPATAWATHTFSDVPAGSTHQEGIDYVTHAGISQGCTEERYCPGDPVTRNQMATFLHRQSGNGPVPPSVNADKVDGLDAEDLRGETGPAGPQGPAGPPGPAGEPGPGMSYVTFKAPGVSYSNCDDMEWHPFEGCGGERAKMTYLPFDASNFASGTDFIMSYNFQVGTEGTFCVRLTDVTLGQSIAGSEVCRTNETPSDPNQFQEPQYFYLKTESLQLPAGFHDYTVEIRGSNASTSDELGSESGGALSAARLIAIAP